MKKQTLFWDVDTQFDFMMPQGKLYVPGAEAIVGAVSDTRRLALDNGFSILADVDWHSTADPEISDAPDFKETFPAHCIAGSPGAERVGYLGVLPVDYLGTEKIPADRLQKLVDKDQFHIVVRKTQLNVFGNPNTAELLKLIRPQRVVVFGVALDFCVYWVIKGLATFPDVKPYVLSDVVRGLGSRPDEQIYAEFRQMGVEITTLSKIREIL